ncbi:hypothetical protein JZ751_028454 [Albula glossodonta]|uniref:Phosphoinositide phospholipase C n=1 Tax=Albula glossodonta TaxID=121402 RepID=A0A8T2NIW1_9TELE|nr:hypothetical protein JZ751_028454 [Albula glossodonta]
MCVYYYSNPSLGGWYLRRADQNQDGKMSYEEVKRLLQMINIDLSEQYARSLFKCLTQHMHRPAESRLTQNLHRPVVSRLTQDLYVPAKCDRSGDGRLDHVEIEEFCRELLRRPELDSVFRRYSSNGCVLTTMELRDFLGDQGEDASLQHAQSLILTYELNSWAHKHQFMTQNGFTMYMLSQQNDVFNPTHSEVYQDMTQPLSHYFISSSHNTYLTKDQVTSASSTEPYIRYLHLPQHHQYTPSSDQPRGMSPHAPPIHRDKNKRRASLRSAVALNQGCRCVELDCWDGDRGEPVIYHGHTLTSKVPFKEVIETIAEYAFKASPYPLILSLENHCSVEQQAVMAQHLRSILGDRLLTKPLSSQSLKQLPSPEVGLALPLYCLALSRSPFTFAPGFTTQGFMFHPRVKRGPFPSHFTYTQQAGILSGAHSAPSLSLTTGTTMQSVLTLLILPGRCVQDLKGRILVKGKKMTGHLGKMESCSGSSSEDESSGGSKAKGKKDPGKPVQSLKLSPELSALVVYCQSVHFHGFDHASKKPPSEMSSFSENDALKHIKDSGKSHKYLSRIYPSGQRLQSSNYDPQEMWNGGCQMGESLDRAGQVALNFQTPGEQMDLNQGRFLPNGRSGYILKPSFLRCSDSEFNPENTGGGPGHVPTVLNIRRFDHHGLRRPSCSWVVMHHTAGGDVLCLIFCPAQVISAQQLPKLNTDKPNSIVDPQVWVEIHGVGIDNTRDKTHRIDNNGFNPHWDCTLTFHVQVPELALVRFVVEDHDHTAKNDFVGQFTLPFTSLRTGYRHVHLLKADGSSLSPATLFIHVTVSRGGVPIRSVSKRMV